MNDSQNVQRLNNEQQSVSKVLENLVSYDQQILEERDSLINTERTKGNNRYVNSYKQKLPNQLCPVALSWCVGLVLSDATVQRNGSKTNKTCRLKIQQVEYNKELLEVTEEMLKPWVFVISRLNRGNMYSLTTVQHQAFNVLSDIFQNPDRDLDYNACVEKRIPDNIIEYLDPIAISGWFCGDGGRADYGSGGGKAVQFHCQGFPLECIQKLEKALRERYKWRVKTKFDYRNENTQTDHYLLEIHGNSFDSFERCIRPYVLESFLRKLPSSRSPRSRFAQNVEEQSE